jgi:hypothetical protein
MKCPICGKNTLPGAKLCSPCRAALKRAKDDSVWELPPSQRPGESTPDAPRSAPWVLGAPRFAGWRAWALGLGVLAVVAGAGLQLSRHDDATAQPVATAIAPAHAIVAEPPAAALQRAIPASTQAPADASPPATTPAVDDVPPSPRHADHPPRAPKAKPTSEPPVAPAPPALEPTPEPAPVAVPAPAPVARPVDPWQRMSESMARCRNQDLFGRLGCEYRVRTSFCEGHWGEVPQCPPPTTNDHGQ